MRPRLPAVRAHVYSSAWYWVTDFMDVAFRTKKRDLGPKKL